MINAITIRYVAGIRHRWSHFTCLCLLRVISHPVGSPLGPIVSLNLVYLGLTLLLLGFSVGLKLAPSPRLGIQVGPNKPFVPGPE